MKKRKKKNTSKGSRNRRKGHNAERHFTNIFKENGFPMAITTRYGSPQKDDCGIDIMNVPINVQTKAGYAKGLNYSKELKYIKTRIIDILKETSPEARKPTILIHRKDVGQGRRRSEFDDIVAMSFSDFLYLFNLAFNDAEPQEE